MNFSSLANYTIRYAWLCTLLTICLQRMPALRFLAGGDFVSRIGVGHVLRAIIPAAVAATAGVDTLTGATTLVTQPATPVSGTVGVNLSITFAYTGGSATPESYRIRGPLPPGTTVPNATGPAGNLLLNGVGGGITGVPTTSGSYSVTIEAFDGPNGTQGENGSSGEFTIAINIAPAPNVQPAFSQSPLPATVDFGANVTFTVVATGTPAPTLQWRRNSQNLPNQTGATLVLTSVTLADAGSYDCVATNASGVQTSAAATLAVNPPPAPVINADPVAMTSLAGTGAFFSVQASGLALDYQWKKDNADIPNETGPTLFLDNVDGGDAGLYSCEVSNPGGTSTTPGAALTIATSGSARLVNLSARAQVGTGADILIPGFAVAGGGTKNLLVRAVGPRLGMDPFFLPGVLLDPTMIVFTGALQVAANDDWGLAADQPGLAAATVAVGAFTLDDSTKDSALVVALASGSYTVQTSGVGFTTGVSLIELYDIDPPSSPGRLVNLSARAQVGTGGDILIPGFAVSGDVAVTLLIRAVGPTLVEFGVAGFLPNPVMTIFRDDKVVALNDDWEQAPNQAALAAAEISTGAFPLHVGEQDSALLVALNPGAYTVQVAGEGGGIGVSLVELYVVGP